MMARRRCASPTWGAGKCTPAPSGPRCWSESAIDESASWSTRDPAGPTIPAMPHTLGSAPRAEDHLGLHLVEAGGAPGRDLAPLRVGLVGLHGLGRVGRVVQVVDDGLVPQRERAHADRTEPLAQVP